MHSQVKQTSVFFNSIAAKGLREGTFLELEPLTCFVGLSGGVASCDMGLNMLHMVSSASGQGGSDSLLRQIV